MINQTNEQLAIELANIKNAIDQAAIIAITDDKGVIKSVNDKFCQISQYSKAELIGQTHRIVNSGYHPRNFFVQMWKTIRSGRVWRAEVQNRAKDGSYYWVDTTIVPIMDEVGNIREYISFRADITDRKEIEKALRKSEGRYRNLALYDQLSSLPNWTYMEEKMNQMLLKEHPFYFFTLDIDRFKFINESYGLQLGDRLLQEVAERLKLFKSEHVKTDLVVARRSGDEFSILLPKKQIASYEEFTERLLAVFQPPFTIQGLTLHVHVSIGITAYPEHSKSSDSIFQTADIAMYKAKEQIGNSYSYYQAYYQENLKDSWQLENDLRDALKNNEFELVYQPIFDITGGGITSVEVLIRWNHPIRGPVSPALFIPLAEERGLIVEIGEWIFREAFTRYRTIRSLSDQTINLSINVSIVQLVQENFIDTFQALLTEYGIQPENVKLEITETATMKHLKYIHSVLHQLKEMNILLAIDDFGTGYSSLNYLRKLPVDIVKIDRSFIQDMPNNTVDIQILKAITSVCQSLSLQTIAEGVETVEQLDMLRECQCDKVQGFLLGKPMKLVELKRFLKKT